MILETRRLLEFQTTDIDHVRCPEQRAQTTFPPFWLPCRVRETRLEKVLERLV